ncbi:MAG: protein TolQ [Myxococcota bacterium]|nr:protein TolQ [Myxococcota bacterium]
MGYLLLQAAATAPHRLDPWQLILHASLVVKLVMLVLAGMSLVCWFIIGTKAVRMMAAQRTSARFLDFFWSKEEGNAWGPERLEAIYARLGSVDGSPLARVFHAGYVELAKVSQTGANAGDIENVERSLRRATSNEMTRLENALPFLATTGSTAPFIGLFGTVWGIMNSFLSIGAERGATLDVVAPGIAEALIATAIGLLAAIPAVMAYNYFVRRIRVIESETEAFAIDYLNIVRRHFLA